MEHKVTYKLSESFNGKYHTVVKVYRDGELLTISVSLHTYSADDAIQEARFRADDTAGLIQAMTGSMPTVGAE